MGIDKFNSEGYYNPTTYEALTNVHCEEVAAEKKAAYLPLVYVCSPYAGDIENNVANAKKYQNGEVRVNHNCFLGYTKDENGHLVIEPEGAIIVRRIFREYLQGKSLKNIADGLTAEGYLTAGGKLK